MAENLTQLIQDAENGDSAAQNQLGAHYDQQRDLDEAIKWFRQADAQGLMISTHNLACKLYEKGEIVEGRKLFEKAAKADYPASLYYMGVIFERENDVRGISCYVKAAHLGNSSALEALQDMGIESMLTTTPVSSPIYW